MSRQRESPRAKSGLSDEALRRLARERSGVQAAQIVAGTEVATAPWVRLKCQFGCDNVRIITG